MDSSSNALSAIQTEVLSALAGEGEFYLSGGAALARYYLHHRRSHDLDMFTPNVEEVEHLARRLRSIADQRGWRLSLVQTFTGFRRFSIEHRGEGTLVDIVHEPVHQEVPSHQKPTDGSIRYDSLEDLVANKLGALLGRGDVKDLVDLYFLEQDGVDLIGALPAAQRKEGGVDPATLAWVAGDASTQIDDLLVLRSVSPDELEAFRDAFVERLLELSWPPEGSANVG